MTFPLPRAAKGEIRTEAYKVSARNMMSRDVPREIAAKLCTTLGTQASETIALPISWFQRLAQVLPLL